MSKLYNSCFSEKKGRSCSVCGYSGGSGNKTGNALKKVEPSTVGFSDVGIQGLGSGLGNLRQAFQYSMNTQESIRSAFLKGIKNLSKLSDNDQKFVQQASVLLSQKQQFYDILLGLFE